VIIWIIFSISSTA